MASVLMDKLVQHIRRAVRPTDGGDTDSRLLDLFIAQGDEAAFASLVQRHGPMVLGVCRRVLGNNPDAEDAFQATFIVLVRKAASLRTRETVGNWLYGVAYRTAKEARRALARRRLKEGQVTPRVETTADEGWGDVRAVLDEEMARLPNKYREVLVLCDVEGEGRKEAAGQLGCPEGTVASRLARARTLLASRLTRRGVAFSAGSLAVLLAGKAASATVPLALTASTIKAATLVAAGNTAAAGALSAQVAFLTEGVLKSMLLTKVKIAASALMLLAVLGGVGTTLLSHRADAEKPAEERGGVRGERGAPQPAAAYSGKVVEVAKSGKSFSIEVPGQTRGDDAKKVEIKLGDKTEILYFGVGTGGAKLTEGYTAQVWTAEGSKDVAAKIQFHGTTSGRRGSDLNARVEKVSADGKVITFRSAGRRGESEDKTTDVRITDKTIVVYSYIAKGGAKPTEGYQADVMLEQGSKDAAATIHFGGTEERPTRGGPAESQPDATGKIIAVAKDLQSFTVEVGGRGRGEEAEKREIKLGDKTKFVYLSVGPNGDQPVEGHIVRVWLAEGSKDTAGKVSFQGAMKERYQTLQGKVVGVAADGKGITLEVAAGRGAPRGEEPGKVEIKITDKTEVAYQGVGPDGAKPTADYHAQVTLADGSKDTALRVLFGTGAGGGGGRR